MDEPDQPSNRPSSSSAAPQAHVAQAGAASMAQTDINNLSSFESSTGGDKLQIGDVNVSNDPSAGVKKQKTADLLSILPDEIIADIFSYFSTKEAYQICLRLSRRYRHLWTLVPVLHFDINEFLPDELQMLLSLMEEELRPYEEMFVNFVTYVLENHAHFAVDAFTLKWKQDEGDPTPATAWLETVGALWKPKFLFIRILAEDGFELPDSIFTCDSLEELVLNLDSDGVNPNPVNLPCLKRLTLDTMMITDEVMQKFLLNLPALEVLVLDFCHLYFPVISSGTLKRLVIDGLCWDDANPPDFLVSIPSPLFLKVCSLVMRKLNFKELQSLAEAQINLKQLSVVEPSFLMGISNVTSLELVLTESCLKV
ncbi:hypothetical protein LUZ63_015492 [Rhynchospora breviuscula]|uniref:F-box domain-containing protein n=1 Tax=Rhynchospora breviuscula TaxID=2022672 RepID=A0A9Q0CCE4_9POAL|nr:hypothetical protein LUZ63_015492 [Rhynchospora breviuscula]